MLFRSINSSGFPFTYTTSVYAGIPVNYLSNNRKFYVYGVEETVKSLIKNLEKMRILREEIYLTIDYTLQYLWQSGFWKGKLLPSELFKLIAKEYQVK